MNVNFRYLQRILQQLAAKYQFYPVYLVESVTNVIESEGQMQRAAQDWALMIWWRVGDQAWVEPTDKLT
jgi:hypothetical protein